MIFLFFISYIFLFEALPIIKAIGLKSLKFILKITLKLFKCPSKIDDSVIAQSIAAYLLWNKVIDKPNADKRGVAGKNFDEFYDFFFDLMEDDKNNRLPSANQLLKVLIAFAFIYYLFWHTTSNSIIGTVLIILICTIIILGDLFNRVIQTARKGEADIAVIFNFLATEKILLQLMQRVGFSEIIPSKLEEKTTSTRNLYTKFNYIGKDYIVYIYYSETSIKRAQVNQAIEISKKMPDCHLIFVVSKELSEKGKVVWDNYPKDDKTIIQFNDNEDLVEKFITEFE